MKDRTCVQNGNGQIINRKREHLEKLPVYAYLKFMFLFLLLGIAPSIYSVYSFTCHLPSRVSGAMVYNLKARLPFSSQQCHVAYSFYFRVFYNSFFLISIFIFFCSSHLRYENWNARYSYNRIYFILSDDICQ